MTRLPLPHDKSLPFGQNKPRKDWGNIRARFSLFPPHTDNRSGPTVAIGTIMHTPPLTLLKRGVWRKLERRGDVGRKNVVVVVMVVRPHPLTKEKKKKSRSTAAAARCRRCSGVFSRANGCQS